MYEALITALTATTIPFAEYEWATRPTGDYGTYQLDFETDSLVGDDIKLGRIMEGSVDLFLHGRNASKIEAVETALTLVCGASWKLNSEQYEAQNHLLHLEWVFRMEDA